uniref:Putative ribonuclease H-like domain-containing protein n=1 Tax=Tanacetum cinerariifolium TaxID=118510 RepID=A0A699HG64_TANCI|nr:putative ribonuclease H-like domain-containing protein [Tanacetum cinerariifolium]
MIENIAYLSDFKKFDRGYVTFGGGAHSGRIFGKGTLITNSLDFENVYFVNELKFNPFSVSQMCDKKNYVFFTDNECLVLSSSFKLPNKSQILLKISKKDNMYSFDMKNIVPKDSLTSLVAKATLDESLLWHIRLVHINFKNINKLIQDNFVRGLPIKRFENDQTCVACLKGKQHRASYKSKVLNPITKPLFMLHMDLFGPTFMNSLMRNKYCLVITDDYSKFTWVFFLVTKDETSEILKNFIKEIENLVDKKVKIIRCDNGTKFKNKVMDDFCREKGIKREYCVARTPQQNGVAKRRNRTLIEAARTMLADSKLPTTFWAEVVSTACYVQNRVLIVKPHNKTPYELFRGFKPALSFMRLFRCHVAILNTLDNLGKFDGKSDEGFFVGHSFSSKAFRVYNTRTRKVEENLHIGFLENKPIKERNGPKWLFDIYSLTQSMNYVPVAACTILDESAGTQRDLNAGTSSGKEATSQDYIVMPIWKDASYFGSPSNDVEDGPHNEDDDKDKSEYDSSPKEVNAVGQHVWILMDLPYEKKAIGTKWVFKNKKDERGIVIRNKASQDKYVNEILKKFNYSDVKSASTPVDLEKPLVRDKDANDVDVHLYKSMIGSLMYLTASRPDIMFVSRMDKRTCYIKQKCVKSQSLVKFKRGRDIKIHQSGGPPKKVGDEAVHKELGDRIKRVATTTSSLEAKQDSGSGPRCQDTILRDVEGQTRFEAASKQFNDLPLSRVNTLGSINFLQIVDFLNSTHIKYALTKNPVIYVSLIRQFWESASSITYENGEIEITATIDGRVKSVTEASIRRHLKLEDSEGISNLPNTEFFEQLALMGYVSNSDRLTFQKGHFSLKLRFYIHTILHCLSLKKIAWEQFSSNITTAIICLATNKTFNFSKMIFEGMLKNLDNKSKFLIYPRFIQIFLNKHKRLLKPHKSTYVAPTLTQKLFSNIRKASKGYSRVDVPLFPTMLVQGPIYQSGLTISPPPISSPLRVPTPLYDSTLPGGNTPGSEGGRMTLNELTVLCTSLSKKVESLESDLKQIKLTYGAAYSKLIMKLKKLENKVKSSKASRRVRLIVSEDEDDLEDPFKQGRKIAQIDKDKELLYTANVPVTTAGAEISTAIPEDKTAKTSDDSDDITLAETLIEIKRSATKPQKQEEATIVVLTEEFDEIQAKIDADHKLAARLTYEEQKQFIIEEMAKLLVEFFKRRKKQLAAERADGSSKNCKIFSEMLDDFHRQDVIDLHRLVQERYDTTGLNTAGERLQLLEEFLLLKR